MVHEACWVGFGNLRGTMANTAPLPSGMGGLLKAMPFPNGLIKKKILYAQRFTIF